ncbi:MAG: hypothetical protein ABI779_00230 [Acidobacteriota bacterium]
MRFHAFITRLLFLFAIVVSHRGSVLAQLPPSPAPRREVFAGETYTESFQVTCVAGFARATAVADVKVTVDPPAFTATVSPTRVSPGTVVTLTAVVPVTTPAQDYRLTLIGIRRSGDCGSGSESFTLTVRRPLRLDVKNSIVRVAPGQPAKFDVIVRGRALFQGPVTLRTSGLPDGFVPTFAPPSPTGMTSTLTVQTPANATSCFAPNGCSFMIRGMADVQVEPIGVRIELMRQVELRPDRPALQVNPGEPATFLLDVIRLGYTNPFDIAVKVLEQPAGGKFTRRVIPERVISDDQVTFQVTVDRTTPGRYRFEVKPANTGVTEVPAVVTVETTGSSIVLSPETQSIDVRGSGQINVNVIATGGEKVTPFGARVVPQGPVSAELTADAKRVVLNVDANAPLGTYQITVDGSVAPAEGGARPITSNTVEITVTDQQKRILLDTDPNVMFIQPGTSRMSSVTIGAAGGFRGRVDLTVTPFTQGRLTASFPNGNSFTITDTKTNGSLDIRFQADGNAIPQVDPYEFVVTATTDPPVPSDTVTLRYRITDLGDPVLVPIILTPTSGAHVPAGKSFLLSVRTTRPPSGCMGAVMYTTDVMPPGALQPFTLPFGDVSQTVVKAAMVTESLQLRLSVVARAAACNDNSDFVILTIDPPPPISPLVSATLAPASRTVQRGQSAGYALTLNRGGTPGPISLALAGLPPGVTASAAPNPVSGDTATITLFTSATTPTGTFPFTVNATLNGALFTTAAGSLMVTAAPTTLMPAITSFTPPNGLAGTQVQIFGTNLNDVQNVLFFNGVGAPFARISSTQVNATVPGFAMTGPLSIVTAGGTAVSSGSFIVGAQSQTPQITSFSPTSGPGGTSVRLQGVNLGGVFDVSFGTSTFGFTPIGFTPVDTTHIDVLIPAALPSGFFRVASPNGTAMSATAFNVTTPNLPEIGGFDPFFGPPGTRVEIIGANLQGTTQVTFGGVLASFEPPQSNRVFALVPPLAVTGPIRLTSPNGTATSFSSFAVTTGGPVITDFQPRMGSEGFSITIAGANLTGTNEVTFNGVRATIGIVTSNFVQAFVPTGATTGLIRLVTPNGETTSPFAFTVQ